MQPVYAVYLLAYEAIREPSWVCILRNFKNQPMKTRTMNETDNETPAAASFINSGNLQGLSVKLPDTISAHALETALSSPIFPLFVADVLGLCCILLTLSKHREKRS